MGGFNPNAAAFDPSGSGWGDDWGGYGGWGDDSWKSGGKDGMPAALDFNVKPEHLAAARAANESAMKNWQSDDNWWGVSEAEKKKTWDDVVSEAKNMWLGTAPGEGTKTGGAPTTDDVDGVFARRGGGG